MRWLVASTLRAFRVCPECGSRFCPVYAAMGEERVAPSIYMRHKGWWK